MDLSAGFRGYPRASGPPGLRNRLLILHACGLNASAARRVAAALPGAAATGTMHGRGQVGADRALTERMLLGFGTHPNVGAVLLLVPDDAMGARLSAPIEASGRPCEVFSLEAHHEDGPALIAAAISAGRDLMEVLAAEPRVPLPASELILATECGHSDGSSGIAANPVLGRLSDGLVAAGGRVILSETLEWTGTEAALRERSSAPVARRLEEMIAARHRTAEAAGLDIYLGNPGPQNHAGGLTTLEEKSLGALAKGGTGRVAGALEHAEPPPGAPGLYLMDTPTLSPESISAMVAAGAQAVAFTTGAGNPYGSALAPTLKITANPDTARRLPEQIDVDVSGVFEGRETPQDGAARLAETLLAVASGQMTAAERAGEGEEAISRLGSSI